MTYHGTLDKREPRGLVIKSRNHIMPTKSINEWKTTGCRWDTNPGLCITCAMLLPSELLRCRFLYHFLGYWCDSEQVLKFVVWGNIWCGYAPADTQFLGTAIFFTLRGVSSSCKRSCYSQSHFFFFSPWCMHLDVPKLVFLLQNGLGQSRHSLKHDQSKQLAFLYCNTRSYSSPEFDGNGIWRHFKGRIDMACCRCTLA